jgi:hypothetical protein
MSNYNFNVFVEYAEMGLSRLKPQGRYISALANSGLSEKDIKRAVKELDKRGYKVAYSDYRREVGVILKFQ